MATHTTTAKRYRFMLSLQIPLTPNSDPMRKRGFSKTELSASCMLITMLKWTSIHLIFFTFCIVSSHIAYSAPAPCIFLSTKVELVARLLLLAKQLRFLHMVRTDKDVVKIAFFQSLNHYNVPPSQPPDRRAYFKN